MARPRNKVSLSKDRYCGQCDETHHISEFRQSYLRNRMAGQPPWLQFSCRKAAARREMARKQNLGMEKHNAYVRSLRRSNVLGHLVNGAKSRAKRAGIEFTISVADLCLPSKCPDLGIPIFVGDGTHGPNSPSIDRIDPTRGYVPDNVRVISYRANTMKSDATQDELIAFCVATLKRLNPDLLSGDLP